MGEFEKKGGRVQKRKTPGTREGGKVGKDPTKISASSSVHLDRPRFSEQTESFGLKNCIGNNRGEQGIELEGQGQSYPNQPFGTCATVGEKKKKGEKIEEKEGESKGRGARD